MQPILQIQNIYKRFSPESWVIQDFSLSVLPGELVCMLGPSGCGKTTLLRLICGFEFPDSGEIKKNGTLVSGPKIHIPPEKRRIGMVFQDYALFPHLTVARNSQFGIRPLHKGRRELEARTRSLLTLTGLDGLENRFPHELSGGQQQRTALARALAIEPDLILLDEPFSNLDASLRHHIRDEVKSLLRKTGTAAIFVTHDQEEALHLSDKIAVMNRGRIEQTGSPEDILDDPASRFVSDFLGMASYLPGKVSKKGVETELGLLPLPPDNEFTGEVMVLLRPDYLEYNEKQGHAVRIVQTNYTGTYKLYTLELPSGTRVQAMFPGQPRLSVGDTVRVGFQSQNIKLFKN